MKKIVQISVSVFLAVFFLTAGTGYNIITYCCSACEHAGIEKMASCCKCNADENSTSHEMCNMQANTNKDECNHTSSNPKSCNFKRLTLEVPTLDNSNFHFTGAELAVLFHFIITPKLEIKENPIFSYFHNPPNFSPLSSGREILTHIATLLI